VAATGHRPGWLNKNEGLMKELKMGWGRGPGVREKLKWSLLNEIIKH
jgi:hypothetical protein